MLLKFMRTIVVSLVVALSATAFADEVWDTNAGQFVYQDDVGPVAVWTYGTKDDPGVIYINGLAKVYKNRGSYDGYWAKFSAQTKCKTSRIGYDGNMTYYWGRFQLHFVDKDFPSRWVADWSYCNAAPQPMRVMGVPVIVEVDGKAGER